jgi:hypothetical protein
MAGGSPRVVLRESRRRDLPAGWNPSADLKKFLGSGQSPVFFGFGSLTPEDTGELTELAAQPAARHGSGW